MPRTIELDGKSWSLYLDRPLAPPGGFGQVFEGESPDGQQVAIKRLALSAGEAADRELKIADALLGKQFEHVISIHAAGAFDGRYYLVMDRAEGSLQQTIASGPLEEQDALDVLRQIVDGLLEVETIVHRDLKPANVLLQGEKWKLADFGIAKFVEDATSARTVKDCLSALYAAPEQWEYESCTHATDVYALGCTGYALVTGSPPFSGSRDELQRAHRTSVPPRPEGISAPFWAILSRCLTKSPQSRPTLQECRTQIEHASRQPAALKAGRLAAAAAALREREATEAAARSALDMERRARQRLAADGWAQIERLRDALFEELRAGSPEVAFSNEAASLGQATLRVSEVSRCFDPSVFADTDWDIVSGALISVRRGKVETESANLWYAAYARDTAPKLFEVQYKTHALFTGRAGWWGVGGSDLKSIKHAHSRVMSPVELATSPKRLEADAEAAFVAKWVDRFAAAVN